MLSILCTSYWKLLSFDFNGVKCELRHLVVQRLKGCFIRVYASMITSLVMRIIETSQSIRQSLLQVIDGFLMLWHKSSTWTVLVWLGDTLTQDRFTKTSKLAIWGQSRASQIHTCSMVDIYLFMCTSFWYSKQKIKSNAVPGLTRKLHGSKHNWSYTERTNVHNNLTIVSQI